MNPNKIFNQAFEAYQAEKYAESERLYKKLLTLKPEIDVLPTIYYNLGLALMSLNKHSEAIKVFDISNRYKNSDETTWCKCLSLFNLKKWEDAIAIADSRYGKTRNSNTAVTFPNLPIQKIKDANDAKDKKILVFNEQGLGDELLFCTQLTKLDKIVSKATVQVSKETIDLLNELYQFQNITLSCFDTISIEDVHLHDCYMGLGDVFYSLYEFGTSVVEPNFISIGSKNVGVCWQTNRKSPNSDKRSIDPKIFTNLKNINLVNLQYGEGQGTFLNLPDFMPNSILETWKKLDNLDLVITVDTMLAHLAGLKGIPTLLIINKHYDWRWKYRDSEDERYSMFYPMVEIVNIKDDLQEIVDDIICG